MSDFLRITTPLVNKNQNVQPKPGIEPTGQFSVQNSVKVIQTHNQSELLKQNTGLKEESEAPTMLLNLLKDPGVTVSYLKNIYLLEELFKLLPANNKTLTQGIDGGTEAMLLRPEALAQEMKNQENASTAFKGELFDFLRNVSENESGKPEVQIAIAKFLRALYSTGSQRDILDSVANNLTFLRSELSASKTLSEKLDALLAGYAADKFGGAFSELKSQTLTLVKQIEDSVLFSPKIAKIISILTYNLSRYNTDPDYVADTALRLRQYLSGADKRQFNALFEPYLALLRESGGFSANSLGAEPSKVISILVDMISKRVDSGIESASDSLKLEGMLHSLLSSPCNFTPLLHYILPLQYDNIRAFAEIWIDPESDEKDMPAEAGEGGMHLLMVVETADAGRVEAEFFVYNKTVDLLLMCPKGIETRYEEMMRQIPKLFADSSYRLGKTQVSPLDRTRSLMEVFKSLPYRRVGVDVKV